MWIKSEEGKLFNLESAHCVQVEDRGAGQFVVVIEYSPIDLRSFNLTHRTTCQTAHRVLDEIENALGRGEKLLNLCPNGDCE